MAYTVAVAAAGKERPSATAAKIKTASHTKFRTLPCARFVTYALTGMDETEERLADGVKRGHWTTEDLAITNRLLRRLTKGLTNYQAYLLSEEGIKRWRMLYEARHKRRIRRSPPNP